MTQQTAAAPSDVLEVEPLRQMPKWEVGKTYYTAGRSRVVIVSTQLRNAKPIAGIMLADSEGDVDEVCLWTIDGRFNASRPTSGVLNLTTEIA